MRSGSFPSNCFTVAISTVSLPPNEKRLSRRAAAARAAEAAG